MTDTRVQREIGVARYIQMTRANGGAGLSIMVVCRDPDPELSSGTRTAQVHREDSKEALF